MLVPSTFTGWYRKTMMTSARPMAMRRSRVQTRISVRREWAVVGAGAEVSGTEGARGWFWSVLCIFMLPSIYNMRTVGRARLQLRGTLTDCRFRCGNQMRFTRAARALPAGYCRVRGRPARLLRRKNDVQAGEGGNHGSFCAKDELAEGGLLESGGTRGGEFLDRPAAFGADGERGRGRIGSPAGACSLQ